MTIKRSICQGYRKGQIICNSWSTWDPIHT